VVCYTCKNRLRTPHNLFVTTLYSSNLRRRQTRSEASRPEEDCSCCVCTRAKLNGAEMLKFRRESAKLRAAEKENCVPGGGRHPLKLCNHCYANLYPGCPHECEAIRQVCKRAMKTPQCAPQCASQCAVNTDVFRLRTSRRRWGRRSSASCATPICRRR
jgi:hypothetical protein